MNFRQATTVALAAGTISFGGIASAYSDQTSKALEGAANTAALGCCLTVLMTTTN